MLGIETLASKATSLLFLKTPSARSAAKARPFGWCAEGSAQVRIESASSPSHSLVAGVTLALA
jgi:hypothetical protein